MRTVVEGDAQLSGSHRLNDHSAEGLRPARRNHDNVARGEGGA